MVHTHSLPQRFQDYARRTLFNLQGDQRIRRMARLVANQEPEGSSQRPIVFFNASTRITDNSLNAAFSLVASWAARLAGLPVVHFVCQAGMRPCVQGTNRDDFRRHPPCRACIRRSSILYTGARTYHFGYRRAPELAAVLSDMPLDKLISYEHRLPSGWGLPAKNFPLGKLVLPATRWILRRHSLQDDEQTCFLYREYMLSAWNVACEFYTFMQRVAPQLVVVFNGQFFPEATVRWLAQQRGLRVITHEVGLYSMTGFFTDGEATIYPIRIPDDYDLDSAQNAHLDAYLEKRFRGKFSMAGIQFWPEMQGLDAAFLEKATRFRHVVSVFTNVIFDTSQPHSNTVFPDMFAWLDTVLGIARKHPETFFVIRAHPDETRPGKSARESVAMWVEQRRASDLPNVMFVRPDEYISSYELIRRSKFIMIYNSTIGLEASIMGMPVLAAGRSRFTDYQTVFYPATQEAFRRQVEQFLKGDQIVAPPEHQHQARRFLYYQVFRMSLPFDDYFEPGIAPGFVFLKPFDWQLLLPENSPTIRAILNGLLKGTQFELEDA